MMTLLSPAFEDSQEIPQKFGKKTENISIPLAWKDAPMGTRSFALIFIDKSLHPRYYIHWMIKDIGSNISELEQDAVRNGKLPKGSKELKPYAGPFPPSGTHVYEFTLYALDVDILELPEKPTLEIFLDTVNKNVLGTTRLLGKFTKNR
jgi:hypothetical protein